VFRKEWWFDSTRAHHSAAAGLLEPIDGILIVLGLATRPVAFILSGAMALGYFVSHASTAFSAAQRRRFFDFVLFCLPLFFCRGRRGLTPRSVASDGVFRAHRGSGTGPEHCLGIPVN
jgi:hypothetical protein